MANLLAALGRGGLQFILIIWLQGIWLPEHGYDFEQTPLWAGIYMVPLTVGFLVAGPVSGVLSDRFGARAFSTGGMVLAAVSFLLLDFVPVDFDYRVFALLPRAERAGDGDVQLTEPGRDHEQPAGLAARRRRRHDLDVPERGDGVVDRSVLLAAHHRPRRDAAGVRCFTGLIAHGVPADVANRVAGLPPVGTLFAALLGDNPIQNLLGPQVLGALPPADASSSPDAPSSRS